MDIKDRIKSHYKLWSNSNGLGNDFNGLRSEGLYAYSTISALLRHYPLAKLEKSRILDFGSGTGRLAKLLIPKTKEYVCSDISDLYISDCKKNLKNFNNVTFYTIDNPPFLEFNDNYFDFTFSYLSLLGYKKEEYKKTLLEIDRVSKNFALHIGNIQDYELGILSTGELVPMGIITLSIEELKELFNQKNYIFEILSPEPSIHPGSLFIFKVADNLNLHLEFGPHIYEKASKTNLFIGRNGELINKKNFLNITLLQIFKFFKKKFFRLFK